MTKERTQNKSINIKGVIDRIEDRAIAVIVLDDESESINLPLSRLPAGTVEGDHLSIVISIDKQSRAIAERETRNIMDDLEKRSGTKGQKNFKL